MVKQKTKEMKKYALILFFVFSGVKTAEAEPTFSLKNKSKHSIIISLVNGNNMHNLKLEKGGIAESSLHEPHAETTLLIYEDPQVGQLRENGKLTPKLGPLLCTLIFTNKTLHLKWKQKRLHPQKGNGNFTTQGYSLNNNITQTEVETESIYH